MDIRAEECSSSQKAEYAVSWSEEGPGRESALNSVRLGNCSQHDFRKFHLNTGLAVRGSIGSMFVHIKLYTQSKRPSNCTKTKTFFHLKMEWVSASIGIQTREYTAYYPWISLGNIDR